MTLKQECRIWTYIAIGALALAGVFALLLVFSRTPVIQDFLPWPWKSFFHKGLVIHVIFSFVVWFLATMAVVQIYELIQSDQENCKPILGKISLALALVGASCLLMPALFDLGEAELNNYVPVLKHPTYYIGLVFIAGSVFINSLRRIGYLSFIYWIALLCFALAYTRLSNDLADATYIERLFWGGGHVLQFVNTALLILTWKYLCPDAFKKHYVSVTLLLLFIFSLPAPFIYFISDVLGQLYRDFFTDQLRYGLPLPSTIATFCLFTFLLRNPQIHSVTKLALWMSLFTFNLGGLYGLFLDGTDTRVPAHYHAVIGGINLAFMAFYHQVIFPIIGSKAINTKWWPAQYWFYGLGQIMHASGMFLAGFLGVPRKTAGGAQALDSFEKILSMGLMGVGGIIAVIGGVLFVVLTLKWLLAAQGEIYEKT